MEVGSDDIESTPAAGTRYGLRKRVRKNLNETAICARNGFVESDSDSDPFKPKPKGTQVSSLRSRKQLPSTSLTSFDFGDSLNLNSADSTSSGSKLKKVECKLCSRTLYDSHSLKRHMERVHNSNWNTRLFNQKCTKCSLNFTDSKSLQQHYCNVNSLSDGPPTLNQFPMITIKDGPTEGSKLRRTSNMLSCEQCGRKYSRADGLKQHMQIHTGKQSKCSICAKTFNLRLSLLAHIRRRHRQPTLNKEAKKEKLFKCQHCPSRFVFETSWKIHERKHMGTMPFGCPICPKRFKCPAEVKYCIMRHTGDYRFKCTEQGCDKAYIKQSLLNTHIMIHTGERPYTCRVCKRAFMYSSKCLAHERKSHKYDEPRPRPQSGCDSRPPPPPTPTRKKILPKRASKKSVTSRKAGRFNCRLCGKSFSSKSHRMRHETTVNHVKVAENISEMLPAEPSSTSRLSETVTGNDNEPATEVDSVVEEFGPISEEREVNKVILSEITVKDEDEDMEEQVMDGETSMVPEDMIDMKEEDLKPEPILPFSKNPEKPEPPTPIYCPYCYISVQNNVELEEHGRTKHAVKTGSKLDIFLFKCPHLYCVQKLKSMTKLKMHQRNIHKLNV